MDSTNVEVRWKELPSSPFKAFCQFWPTQTDTESLGFDYVKQRSRAHSGSRKARSVDLGRTRGQREGLRAGLGPAQSPQDSLEVEVSRHPRRSY